jgi:guanylate kinase
MRNFRTLLGSLNLHDFGFMDLTFRKCRQDSSVKGIVFFFVEIARFKRIRKYSEKLEALELLSEQMKNYLKFDVKKGANRTVIIDIMDEDIESVTNTDGKGTSNYF